MKRLLMFVPAVLLAAWVPVVAQAGDSLKSHDVFKQEIELTRAALETQRKAVIAQSLQLFAEEESAFWSVYNDYRAEMQKVGNQHVAVITDYADAYRNNSVSDKQAAKLLDRYLKVMQNRIKVKKAFVRKFKKVLPAKKVARFYQIDNRLDLLLNLQIAEGVPLVE